MYARVLIEDKEEIKKRLGRSPDSADALALCFAMPQSGAYSLEELQTLSTHEEGRGSKWVFHAKPRIGSRWRK